MIRKAILLAVRTTQDTLQIEKNAVDELEQLPNLSKVEERALHCLRHIAIDQDIIERDGGYREYQRELLAKFERSSPLIDSSAASDSDEDDQTDGDGAEDESSDQNK